MSGHAVSGQTCAVARRVRTALAAVLVAACALVVVPPAQASGAGHLVGRLVREPGLNDGATLCLWRVGARFGAGCVDVVRDTYVFHHDVSPGRYRLSLLTGDHDYFGVESEPFDVTSSTRVLPTVTMSAGAPLTGVVKDRHGQPIPGAHVSAVADLAPAGPTPDWESMSATTDGRGRFSVPARPGWRYRTYVNNRGNGRYPYAGREVTLREAGTTPSTVYASTIHSTAGFTTVKAKVAARRWPGLRSPVGTVTVLEGSTVLAARPIDEDAVARITLPTLAAGTHTLTLVFSGHTDVLSSRDTLTVKVTGELPPTGDPGPGYPSRLEGHVRSRDGRPARSHTVTGVAVDCSTGVTLEPATRVRTASGSDGTFVLATETGWCYDISAVVDDERVTQRAVPIGTTGVVLIPRDQRSTPTVVSVTGSTNTYGSSGTVTVSVTRADGGFAPVKGRVVLLAGDRLVASTRVTNAVTTTLPTPRLARVGNNRYTVAFRPDSGFRASSTAVTQQVTRGWPSMRVRTSNFYIYETGTITVRISAATPVTGTIRLTRGGGNKLVATAKLSGKKKSQRVTFKVPYLLGGSGFTVTYSGSSTLHPVHGGTPWPQPRPRE